MKINIIRGQNQIGGSIIEISTDKTKIVFDVGINLDESEEIEIPEIDGLFCGKKKYDAVFISHYHSDHIGLLDYIVEDIPIYMGERAYKIVKAANETGAIVTAEEHSIIGGLGEAVASVLCEKCPAPIVKIGVKDRFGYSGPATDLIPLFGLDATSIANAAKEAISKAKEQVNSVKETGQQIKDDIKTKVEEAKQLKENIEELPEPV